MPSGLVLVTPEEKAAMLTNLQTIVQERNYGFFRLAKSVRHYVTQNVHLEQENSSHLATDADELYVTGKVGVDHNNSSHLAADECAGCRGKDEAMRIALEVLGERWALWGQPAYRMKMALEEGLAWKGGFRHADA